MTWSAFAIRSARTPTGRLSGLRGLLYPGYALNSARSGSQNGIYGHGHNCLTDLCRIKLRVDMPVQASYEIRFCFQHGTPRSAPHTMNLKQFSPAPPRGQVCTMA